MDQALRFQAVDNGKDLKNGAEGINPAVFKRLTTTDNIFAY